MNLQWENNLFKKIKGGDEKAFETVFHHFYGSLCIYASQILHDTEAAEEVVQDMFVGIWEKRHMISIETSVKSYLFRSVRNRCMNVIKHNKTVSQHARQMVSEQELSLTPEEDYDPDLYQKIEESIRALPEKRQEIFRLSREKGYKYREIADLLQISIKTVETQMGLAIKTLRENLKDYFPL